MERDLIEHAWIDPDVAPLQTSRILHLTDPAEPKWTGIIELGPHETFVLERGHRYDFYVLQGTVEVAEHAFEADDFFLRTESGVMQAGPDGARLLAYRQPGDESRAQLMRLASTRAWRAGVNPLMGVATLDGGPHHISLVSWQPGAETRVHTHPRGEEMFVLSGELSSGDERYPAGTWLRLHPGSTHAPFATVPATILLRHGHLVGA
jgi:hypothetical protein